MDEKELLLSLIKADMCNNKLIIGLENTGLIADDFYGDLETVILKLMGFDLKRRETELHDFYYDTMTMLLKIEVKVFRENLNQLAEEMYVALLEKWNA